MASAVINMGIALVVFTCFGVLVFMTGVLICFVVGELQRIGRKRATKRREKLETDLAAAKARDEIRKRKERLAAKEMRDEEVLEFEQLRRQVLDGA